MSIRPFKFFRPANVLFPSRSRTRCSSKCGETKGNLEFSNAQRGRVSIFSFIYLCKRRRPRVTDFFSPNFTPCRKTTRQVVLVQTCLSVVDLANAGLTSTLFPPDVQQICNPCQTKITKKASWGCVQPFIPLATPRNISVCN